MVNTWQGSYSKNYRREASAYHTSHSYGNPERSGNGSNSSASGSDIWTAAKSFASGVWVDLRETGNKLKLGRKHRPDYLLFILAIGLSTLGLIIVYSIASGVYDGDTATINREMAKRILFLIAGIIAFIVAGRIPLEKWKEWAPHLFLFALIICAALPILGKIHAPLTYCALGACRWYMIGPISFQPAELMKLATVLFMAGYLSTRLSNGKLDDTSTLEEVIIVMVLVLGSVVGLQKDMGTGVALLAIFLLQLYLSGMSKRRLGFILGLMIVGFILMIIVAPHRMERILTFTKSGNSDTDYHINQAMIALGSGGLFGRGLGQSVQAFGWLPEAVNDSIFAIIGESLGFVGTVGLIIAFGVLIFRMLERINYLDNMYLRLIVAGVVGWFTAHVLANTMAMTRLIPLTGITLPLVSSGGTSLVFVMTALGIVFAVSRYTTHRYVSEDEIMKGAGQDETNSVRGRRQRRSHYTYSRSN